MEDSFRRSLLHLASAINHTVSALEQIKPDCIKPGATLLTGSFQGELSATKQALVNMLNEIGAGERNG